ncbi:MAG: PRTRC system ParB family protein [Rubrivivax sp.]|nr:PRTRC system ParB family protein [Burkholderiales bacterium]MCW5633538.1 PRTRC system ParB family protein [Rubrivivax sp.]
MNLPATPTLPIRRIVQGDNPREHFDPAEMADLEEGIRAVGGVIQPIVVRPVPGTDDFAIVVGERRWRAAKTVLGDDYDMPVLFKEVSPATAEAMAVIENHHRAPMSAAEQARAAQRQLHRNHGDKAETAAGMGWKPELLARRLALLTCTPSVLAALTKHQIQLGHAELLTGVPPDMQDRVLAGLLAHKVPVAVLKDQLGKYARRLADAIFDTAPCAACPHNSTRQAGLFADSIREGHCQHPTHFDELTQQAVDAKASALCVEYPVVHVIRQGGGFVPLHVTAEGELGVGAAQYASCQGCKSYGAAVSAMPGSSGAVTASLCFDAACNSQKVARWRKATREDAAQQPLAASQSTASRGTPSTPRPADKRRPKAASSRPTNQTPQRVVEYRTTQWRKWLAAALMAQPQRSHRVLIALTLAGRAADLKSAQFEKALAKIAGPGEAHGSDLREPLRRADQVVADQVDRLVQAAIASAAFGVDTHNLELLLNYLDVDEARCFRWDKAFLDLFTTSELESLAADVGLKAALGARFKTARAGKKDAFVQALLNAEGFAYQGTVPAVMRYPRHGTAQEATVGVEDASDAAAGSASTRADAEAPATA